MNEFEKITAEQLKKLNDNISKVLNRAGIKMKETTLSLMEKKKSYASGRLRELTAPKIKDSVLTFGSNASNRGFKYGLTYEFGRKAGSFPNIKDLRKWVSRKYRLGLLNIKRELGTTLKKRIDTVTFLIARAIKMNGTKGKFHFKAGFVSGVRLFDKEINQAILGAFN